MLPYPLPGEDSATYNAKLRQMALEIIDLYKLAFPGAANLVREFGGSAYSLEDLEADMREYTRLPAPWLLLSGGLEADRFV